MEEKDKKKSVFATLSEINVNEHTEKKPTGGNKELTYLSWPWAMAEVMKRYPDMTYTIYRDEQNRPYIEDADFGLICMTTVTIEGQTREMWLPVMDSSNKAMRRQPYSYKVFDYQKKQYVERWVQAATMFDINKTIMRCLVKNFAMFGLGLYIYAGEDLPETDNAEVEQENAKTSARNVKGIQRPSPAKAPVAGQAQADAQPVAAIGTVNDAKAEIDAATKKEELAAIFNKYTNLQADKEFISLLKTKKDEILSSNGTNTAA